MTKEKKIKITLVRSIAGRLPKHKAMVASLGLRRIRHTIEAKDIPSIRGVVNKISYLLHVEEVK